MLALSSEHNVAPGRVHARDYSNGWVPNFAEDASRWAMRIPTVLFTIQRPSQVLRVRYTSNYWPELYYFVHFHHEEHADDHVSASSIDLSFQKLHSARTAPETTPLISTHPCPGFHKAVKTHCMLFWW